MGDGGMCQSCFSGCRLVVLSLLFCCCPASWLLHIHAAGRAGGGWPCPFHCCPGPCPSCCSLAQEADLEELIRQKEEVTAERDAQVEQIVALRNEARGGVVGVQGRVPCGAEWSSLDVC